MALNPGAMDNVQEGYGPKSIGLKSSLALTVNNIMGPAMVALPFLAQRAGWLPLVMMNLTCCLCSGLSSAMLCEALQRIPGNFYFTGQNPETGQRYEFCDAVSYYWGKKWSVFVRVLFNLSLQAQNVPAMVISCQVLDDFFAQLFGHVYGIRYNVFPPHVGSCDANDQFVVTIGVVACMLICIPLGCLNLDGNKTFQNISCVCLIALTAMFLTQYIFIGPLMQDRPLVLSRTPFVTSAQAKTLGVILFSWCFPSTLPSWVNEKSPRVGVNFVVWTSCAFSFWCKVLIALFGAWAYELVHRQSQQDAQNILLVMDHTSSFWLTKASAYMFNFSTLIPGIPVIGVIVRYNLISSGTFGKVSASFVGVVLPWIVTVLLYRTTLLVDVLNWAAMLCMGPVNFIIPPLVFLSAMKRCTSDGSGWGSSILDTEFNTRPMVDGQPKPDETRPKEDESGEIRSYGFSGEPCLADVEHTKLSKGINVQASVIAVSPSLRMSRKRLAQAIAVVMAALVTVTILLNLYYIVVLGEDIVD